VRLRSLLIPLLLAAPPALGDTIYKWIDDRGVTHYSQTPPSAGQASKVPIHSSPPGPGTPADKGTSDDWRQRDEEFQKRWKEKKAAEAQVEAQRQSESRQRPEKCRKAREELARLMATKPAIKRRPTISLLDPETDAEVELMNNAERTQKIEQAEQAVRSLCD
jgi:uncharacterized protein DUF4124